MNNTPGARRATPGEDHATQKYHFMSHYKLLTFAAIILSGCTPSDERTYGTPTLQLSDSVILAESDSTFLSEASGFAIAPDGSFLVSDHRNAVLHLYSRDGRHLGSIGRRGDGPSEWSRGPFFVKSDGDVVAVADGHRFKTLEYPSGRVISEIQRPPGSGFVAFANGKAYFRLIDRATGTTFETVDRDGTSERGGTFTPAMGRSTVVDNMFSFVALAPLENGRVALGYQNSDYIFFGPVRGPFDSLLVPVLNRRGSRQDLISAIDDANPQTAERAAYQPSYPFLLSPMSRNDQAAYVTVDQTFEGNRMTGQPYISIVDFKRRQACSDAMVPGPTDPQPWVTITGDTAFILAQDEGPSGSPRSMVRAYVIKQDSCW